MRPSVSPTYRKRDARVKGLMLNGVLAFSAYNVPLIKSGVRHDSVEPIADKWLKDKQVLLHTDSARAYKAKTWGVLHASVVHKKRQVWVGGGWVWEQPTYVKMTKVILPKQKRLTVKVGTQAVDRAWKFIKTHLESEQ